jgi:branched-chain amino acid aminotransferase
LPGVTRDSILHLAREWGLKTAERRISIDEVQAAAREGRLQEAFGAGTAAVVLPIAAIHHQGEVITFDTAKTETLWQKFYQEITGIQYGEKADRFGWCYSV